MKKMISVPVGSTPKLSTYRYRDGDYIDYGYSNVLYPEGSLKFLISSLTKMQTEHRDKYQNMRFESKLCNCLGECSCSPTYVLYGDRYELDIEYHLRLKNESETKAKKEEADRLQYETLKKKFEGDK